MKHKFLIFSCILLLFACKKEKIDDPNFVGKWVLINHAIEQQDFEISLKPLNCNDDLIYQSIDNSSITLEIESNGVFTFESSEGSESFQLISMTSREAKIVNYSPSVSCTSLPPFETFVVNGFDIMLRNKKGHKFKFPLFYVSELDRLITVPWIKNVKYFSNDKVYRDPYFGPFYDFNTTTSGYFNQILGKFKKI